MVKFLKNEIVFVVATICALISMFFVPPSLDYFSYIDFNTICLLFSLMFIVAGFSKIGAMTSLAKFLIKKASSTRTLVFVLLAMCFFSSMVITNDVALITFVPLAISVLKMCKKEKLIIYVVVLQSIFANLGSSLTPMGNPQNLYLYNFYELDFINFILITLPIIIISFLLMVLSSVITKKEKLDFEFEKEDGFKPCLDFYIFLALAFVAILAVLKVFNNFLVLGFCLLYGLVFKREIVKKVDYMLLLTFCSFFIFVGNIEKIEFIRQVFSSLVSGREFLVSIVLSQFISNVPASIMLSGFTNNFESLILGVNVGGLGSLVASLASLISFKIYSQAEGANSKKYLLTFTLYSIGFLAVICLFFKIL